MNVQKLKDGIADFEMPHYGSVVKFSAHVFIPDKAKVAEKEREAIIEQWSALNNLATTRELTVDETAQRDALFAKLKNKAAEFFLAYVTAWDMTAGENDAPVPLTVDAIEEHFGENVWFLYKLIAWVIAKRQDLPKSAISGS